MSNIVTFEQAVRLKEVGFDREVNKYYWKTPSVIEPHFHVGCFTNWNDTIAKKYSAPTVSEALDYLREEKHIPCYVDAGYCYQYDTVGYWGIVLSDFGYIKRVQTEVSPIKDYLDGIHEARQPRITNLKIKKEMKTGKEILNHHYSFVDDLDKIEYEDLLSMISFTQNDAYNQAIDDAVDNVEVEYDRRGNFTVNVDKKSILKLKK